MTVNQDTGETDLLRASVRQFVQRECSQWHAREWDERHHYPEALFKQIAALGWFGVTVPEEVGGSGGGAVDLMTISEELGRGSTDLVACYSLTVSGMRTLARFGTPEQKAHWIPLLMAGERRLSVSVTEPEAGSDAASLSTAARLDGDDFVVNGQKTFCEAAGLPGTLIQLYVRTDPEAPKHRGISMLLLDPDTPGVTLRRLPTLGRNITGVYEIFLDDVRVPRDRLVGNLNEGWRVLASDLALERLIISAGFVGAAFQVLEDVLAYVKERVQFGRPVGTFQGVAHLLVDLFTRAEAFRLLTYRGAELHDQGQPYEKEASMAKVATAELYADAARYGIQMMGGYGYVKEHPITMHYADAVIATVAGGPSQVQRNIVARNLGLKV